MGLDMYLHATQYLSDSDFFGKEKAETYKKVAEAIKANEIVSGNSLFNSLTVSVKVAEWRKANSIHKWFVDNCGEGEDDCRPYHVNRENLEELLELCKEVKKGGPAVAEEKLPPQVGFFFGSYEIDEYYWQDINQTIDDLTRVLARVPEDWDFEYEASW